MSITLGKRLSPYSPENPKDSLYKRRKKKESSSTKIFFESYCTPTQIKITSKPLHPISPDNDKKLKKELSNLLLDKNSVCKFVDFIVENLDFVKKNKALIIEKTDSDYLSRATYRSISRTNIVATIFFLEIGADPNWQNKKEKNRSLLQLAVKIYSVNSVNLLLNAGAKINLDQDQNGDTILHLANKNIRGSEIYKILSKKVCKKDIEIKNKDGKTCEDVSPRSAIELKKKFIEIRKNRDFEGLKEIVINKEPDFLAEKTYTIIVRDKWLDAVPILLEAGANPNWKHKKSKLTLVGVAAKIGRLNLSQQLLALGADISCADINGDTPLHHASRSGVRSVYELFLMHAHSIDPRLLFMKNKKGQIPADVPGKVRKSQSKYR